MLFNSLLNSLQSILFRRNLGGIVGPVYYQNGTITESIPVKLTVVNDSVCRIEIRNERKRLIISGLGVYYGNGHVLTALHVLKGQYGSEIYVTFCTAEGFLGYKAEFTEHCNTYPERDQAFLKLLGNTGPLGNGLQNQVGKVHENDKVYFYTDSGSFQKQDCSVIPCHKIRKPGFVLSKAGKPGDSGSPIFCDGKWVGIYRGDIFTPEFGLGVELYPEMNPRASPAARSWFPCFCSIGSILFSQQETNLHLKNNWE